jgi:hypothetical protein
MSAAEIYAQCLLPLKEGYPLYRPELHRRENNDVYDNYCRKGISIGDVGIIRPGGDFDFLFNICRTGYSNKPSGGADAPNTFDNELGSQSSTVGISEQFVLPSNAGHMDSLNPSPVSPLVSADHQAGRISESSVQYPLPPEVPRTTPADFDLIDAGEISITSNYIGTESPYFAHCRGEQTTFRTDGSLNPIA